MATAASNVPGLVSKPGFTVTSRLTGKLPAVGLTLSHVVPPSVIGVAVKFVTLELELELELDPALPQAATPTLAVTDRAAIIDLLFSKCTCTSSSYVNNNRGTGTPLAPAQRLSQ